MKLKYSMLFLILFYPTGIWAAVNTASTKEIINLKRQGWFESLYRKVLTGYPQENSQASEWDRQGSNEYTAITGERRALAYDDRNQSTGYIYQSFSVSAFGEQAKSLDLRSIDSYNHISELYKTATYAYDPRSGRPRSFDFILKDHFKRGRPYQVLDENGDYIKNYLSVKGSSFPSGHTWSGFRQAIVLSLIFPERGSEIFSRALQFGESRVIVGAHFPTDTIASRVGSYFSLAQLLANESIATTLADLAKATRSKIASGCYENTGVCIAAKQPGTLVYSSNNIGYYGKKEPFVAPRITPDDIPDKAGYLLRLRFPYLTESSWRSILASTAYPRNSLAGWTIQSGNPESFWGVIDLPKAYGGPAYLYDTLVVDQTFNPTFDIAGFSLSDEWKNDIMGPGKLIKNGEGSLTLSGNDRFGGLEVNQGTLIVSGNTQYSDKSVVNGGTLVISGVLNSALEINHNGVVIADGAVNSATEVNQGGLLSGTGELNRLTVHKGGVVTPGHSIGVLNVADRVTFDPGSHYGVEVAANGKSDRIQSAGTAVLNGGSVNVSLENSNNLLTEGEVRSLLGQHYTILTAKKGVSGQFEGVAPDYLFLGTGLSYQPDGVTLNVGRNGTSFASVAQTPNERAVAAVADTLAAGNPVYESILSSATVREARHAFRQLSGQIHADITSALVNDSRYMREALNGRLRQAEGRATPLAIRADESGAWGQILGAWGNASGDTNATGYHASTYGVLVGLDSAVAHDGRLGMATGYTRLSLNGGHGATADSNNYHMAVYGDKQFGALVMRGGAGSTWHWLDTQRPVNYGIQSDKDAAKYSARTQQLYAEAGYSMLTKWVNVEPFVNLAYVNLKSNGIAESGGAAALRGDKQYTDATTSTLGLRADAEWKVSPGTKIVLRSDLGWQHQYGDLSRGKGLRLSGSNAPIVVESVALSREGIALKASAEVATNESATLSLGYGGLLSKHYQDNSVNAIFTWLF
ncbi:autotransporter outer membrane beta-barrel domain-containing protein [Type-D symbiont of Plautia stali]|uniref:autotransporter outer membrane beta-barrel domain-containing protein n=1 Tax=Type-D symbiont of Plautia stali TaxID=1560356 RepID=UPI00092EBF47|nr:autotransporter outer membrane beta-barrel domain-containing protein [Type-D symbiont of Plautia stali]